MDERISGGRTQSSAWGAPFLFGLLVAICGVLALISVGVTSMLSAVFIGILLVAAGILEIIEAFRVRKAGPFLLYLLAGILTGIVGVLFVARPMAGLASLGLLLACYFFASGLFRGITSIADRYAGWGWDFAYGICAVVLGVIVMSQWPISSLWLVGTLVGIELLLRGIAIMSGSLALRRGLRRVTV
jgi:uncharacterized membrane protein HdeD (DUF308 family)